MPVEEGGIGETVERVAVEIVKNGEAFRVAQEARREAREEYRRKQKAKKERGRALQSELKSHI